MNDLKEFEKSIRQHRIVWTVITWAVLLAHLVLALAVRCAIIGVPVALVFGATGWLFGVDDPRSVALFGLYLSVPVSVISGLVINLDALR